MEKQKETPKISPAIEGQFEMVGILPGIVIIKGQEVDFTKISLEQAEELHKNGCRYLKKKATAIAKK